MSDHAISASDHQSSTSYAPPPGSVGFRAFGWMIVATMIVFLTNNYLVFWRDWPGVEPLLGQMGWFWVAAPKDPLAGSALAMAWVQFALYPLSILVPIIAARATAGRTLRADANLLTAANKYIVRAAFWGILLIGLVDMTISFLRVEELLAGVVGDEMTKQLGRSLYRGAYVQVPLMVLALVIAAFTRSFAFHWLALLVVLAEMSIVLSRFIFSYEQAFQGDLVRFWYAGLFLFASAHTLFEDGHVRVDILYSGFAERNKGTVNAIGSLLLGVSLCWIILAIGMGAKTSIITAPLLNFEVSQSGFGMYVKYLMAGFLGVFAITMMVQFASLVLESIANRRGEPGQRVVEVETTH